MKKLEEVFESTLDIISEAKLMVLDTFSGTDSEKIEPVLKKDKIKYKKVGSIFSIELDPKSAKAAVLRSHLNKIAKFDELNESSDWQKGTWVVQRRSDENEYAVLVDKTKKGWMGITIDDDRMIAGKRSLSNAYPAFETTTQGDVPPKLLAKVQKKLKQLKIDISLSESAGGVVTEADLVPGFTFFVLSKNKKSLSSYKITGEKEMNVGTVLEVNHKVITGDKFKQKFISKDFVLGKKGSLQVFKDRKQATSAFKSGLNESDSYIQNILKKAKKNGGLSTSPKAYGKRETKLKSWTDEDWSVAINKAYEAGMNAEDAKAKPASKNPMDVAFADGQVDGANEA
jgi:hypothetical protein